MAHNFPDDSFVAATILNLAFNDQSPSYTAYNNQAAWAAANGIRAFALTFGAGFAGMTEDALSTKLLGNMGVLPNAGLQAALRDHLVSVGKANVGIVALQLGQILSGLENATGDQATYAAAAVRWNEDIFSSHTYSNNPANFPPAMPIGVGLAGVTLALTMGDDSILPTAALAGLRSTDYGDTIMATTAGLLSSGDSIDGGRGVDALKATLAADATVEPMLQNVEHVFLQAGAHSKFMATQSTGITELWREAAGGPAEFYGVDLATTVGIRNSGSGGALSVVFAGTGGSADAATLVFLGAAGDDEVIVDAVENLGIKSQKSGAANTVKITANAAEKISILGDQALTTTVKSAHVSVIDASAFTGALTLAFATTGLTAVSISGGTRGDTFTIDDTSGARVVVEAGHGADTISIGAHNAHLISLGVGADTLNITGLAGPAAKDIDTGTSASLAASAIEVRDFASGADLLRLTGAASTAKATPGSVELARIAAAPSLLEATALAATTAGASKAIAFRYGADTYILVNDGVAALGANDSLVKLAGVAALADATWAMA